MHGFIYIVSNPAFNGLLKVGKTSKDPEIRLVELSMHEGIPAKMALEYFAFVEGNPLTYESIAHQLLTKYHYNKEWFKVDVAIAINQVRVACGQALKYEKILTRENIILSDEEMFKDPYNKYLIKDKDVFNSIIDSYESEIVSSAKSRAYHLVYEKIPEYEIWQAYRGGSIFDKLKGHWGSVDEILKSKFSKEIESATNELIKKDLGILRNFKYRYYAKLQFEEYVLARKNNLQPKSWTKSDVAALMVKSKVNFTDWFSDTIFLDSKLTPDYK
jgi:hypothetical protein